MSLLLVELRRVIQVVERPVDAHATEARLPRGMEEGLPLTLPVAEDGAEDEEARPVGELQDLVNDVIERNATDRPITLRTVRRASTRVEESQVVPDLGDRSHRGARIAR